MIHIDGSFGEGGGQILRTSVALSLLTGKPFQVDKVRGGREKPGLGNQHVMSICAGAKIGDADIDGVTKGSSRFTFKPGKVKAGRYEFRIGTAGSTGLVLQTILPPLLLADGRSEVLIEGGTHNPWAPPYDFLERTFLPLINRTGATVAAGIEWYGFYPVGGGIVKFEINPSPRLQPLVLTELEPVRSVSARVHSFNLPSHIAEREIDVLRRSLKPIAPGSTIEAVYPPNCRTAGNFIAVHVQKDSLCETITSLGGKGIRAEDVAEAAIQETKTYLEDGAPVGEHLADQLLIPLALAGSGSYTTGKLSLHTKTNIVIIRKFLEIDIKTSESKEGRTTVQVGQG